MGGAVRVNSREVVTSRSGGVSFAFGDVCELPDGGGPLPFVNVAVSADAANAARTVRANGVPVVLARSTFARSTGDEPGADGGMISRVTRGAAVFSNYSFDVRFERQPVPRAFDPMLHNLDSTGLPNAASPAELQAAGSADPDLEFICMAICLCHAIGEKMTCLRKVLATPIQSWMLTSEMDPHARPGHKSMVRYWDPHVPPGFYVEPAYLMKPPPPTPMLGPVKSAAMKDAKGEPLPLPGGDSPIIPGSRRPDVVVPLDPTRPPGPGNIKRVFEVKFPPDRLRPGQLAAYQEIAGNAPVSIVSPGDPCKCKGRHKPKLRNIPVPIPEPLPLPKREPEPEPIFQPPVSSPNPVAVGLVGLVIVAAIVGGMTGGPVGAVAGIALVLATKKDEDEPQA